AGAGRSRLGHGRHAACGVDRRRGGAVLVFAPGLGAMSFAGAAATTNDSYPVAGAPSIGRVLLYTLMIAIGVAAAFPLAWMVLSSLKTSAESMQTPPVWLSASPSLDAYIKVAGVIDVGRSFVNSAIIAGVTTLGILVT